MRRNIHSIPIKNKTQDGNKDKTMTPIQENEYASISSFKLSQQNVNISKQTNR